MTPFEAHILIQQTIIPDALISPRRNNTIRTTCVSNTQTKLNATTSTEPPLSNSSGTTESLLREALKSHRLNPNIRFKNESLLCTTIKRGCPNLLKLFLEHGADPNLKSYENGRYEPALITAVRYKSLSCVQILLEYGANLSKTNFYGTDAIFQAVHENAFEILECLLSKSKPQQKQQSFYNHRDHHDRHCSSTTNAKDYQKRQRRQQDVPAALSSSSTESKAAALPESSSSTLPPPPPPDQSINIQKTTTTKGKDSRGNKAVVLNREKPSNNANNNSRSSSKGHEQDDDGDSRIDDDDHVLCPFYYALYYAPSHPSKRESLVRLLQSYYKCKCLEEIASCHQSNFWGDTAKENAEQARNCTAVAGDDEVKECWNVVRNSYVNFSGWWRWWYAKSVPPAGYGALHVDDSVQNYTTQQYHAHDHHPYQCDPIPSTSSFVDVDNENSIKFLLPAESSSKGGEENELSWSNLFPYKIYKIEGKCHVLKENESSSTPSPISVSSSSSSPTPAATVNTRTTRVHKRPPSSYVVLVGPLKLSCITREVIRDQIKFCGSRGTRSIKRSCKNINQTTTSASANGSTLEQQNERSMRSGESTVAPEPLELWLKSEDYFNRMNFRKSLETLMMPSSLMDYILYRNIHWSESRNCSTLLSSSRIGIFRGRGRDENEHTTAAATTDADDDNAGENNELSNNIKLIKRDLELNINYYAIYIY